MLRSDTTLCPQFMGWVYFSMGMPLKSILSWTSDFATTSAQSVGTMRVQPNIAPVAFRYITSRSVRNIMRASLVNDTVRSQDSLFLLLTLRRSVLSTAPFLKLDATPAAQLSTRMPTASTAWHANADYRRPPTTTTCNLEHWRPSVGR